MEQWTAAATTAWQTSVSLIWNHWARTAGSERWHTHSHRPGVFMTGLSCEQVCKQVLFILLPLFNSVPFISISGSLICHYMSLTHEKQQLLLHKGTFQQYNIKNKHTLSSITFLFDLLMVFCDHFYVAVLYRQVMVIGKVSQQSTS